MRRQAALFLTFLFLLSLTLAACGQNPTDTPPAEETLLVDGESGAPEDAQEPPAFDPLVPASEAVAAQWFDEVAFVGDSVSVMLEQYNSSAAALGKATFLCSVSLSRPVLRYRQPAPAGVPQGVRPAPQAGGCHCRRRRQEGLPYAGHELYRRRC